MSPKILDGKWLAACELERTKREAAAIAAKRGFPPGLGVILVGDNQASKVYVGNKEKAAKGAGFQTFDTRLPESATIDQVLEAIHSYNENSKVDGILLQLPVPKQLNSNVLIEAILPSKDADGLHPVNQGKLLAGTPGVRPCTPSGIMRLIDLAIADIEIGGKVRELNLSPLDLSGKTAVVVGRSILVGKPVSLLLLERNATVTMAHSRTKNLPSICAQADILVAAVGKPELVTADWLKPGAIVIDVGINRLADGRLVGDVDYKSALKKASAITPVPGGVGPMTVAGLLSNCLS